MNKWRIFLWWKIGMNYVSFWIASAYSFDHAEQWAAENIHFAPNKKRGWLFKKLGSKKRIYDRADYEWEYSWQDEGFDETFPYDDDEEPETEPPPMLEQGELFPSDDDTRWCERQNKR